MVRGPADSIKNILILQYRPPVGARIHLPPLNVGIERQCCTQWQLQHDYVDDIGEQSQMMSRAVPSCTVSASSDSDTSLRTKRAGLTEPSLPVLVGQDKARAFNVLIRAGAGARRRRR
jgi:hypothetical protein